MEVSLSDAFTYLQTAGQRNFYARVLASLTRVQVKDLGTFGVSISRQGKYILAYDPDYLKKLSFNKLLLVIEHEVLHLMLGHIPRYLDVISGIPVEEEKRRFKAVMNVAADLAVNELIRSEKDFDSTKGRWFYGANGKPTSAPPTPMSTDKQQKAPSRAEASFLIHEMFKLEPLQAFETYMFQLLNRVQFVDVAVAAEGCGHDSWDEGFEADGKEKENGKGDKLLPEEMQGLADKLRQEAKNVVGRAAKEHQKSRGIFSGYLKEILDNLLVNPKIPWPKLLRDMVSRTRQSKPSKGMRRPNRRLHGTPNILPWPGRSLDQKFTIGYALDTSGSMSEEDLRKGVEELMNIVTTEQDVTMHVLYADADIQTSYKVESINDIDFTIKGRGGTDFNPVFQRVREMLVTDYAPDILVYCTDGYAPEPDVDNRVPIPVIWLITPNGRVPSPNYGHHITMEPY